MGVYVKFHIKPECIEEWRRAVTEIVECMSHETAFVACCLLRGSQDPNLFTLYERWTEPSVESFMAHQMKPYRAAYEARLPAMLRRPREATVLRPLGQWHKPAP